MNAPFTYENVIAGFWEFFHDDDCGAVLDPETKICSTCKRRPDLQSMGARRTSAGELDIIKTRSIDDMAQDALGGASLWCNGTVHSSPTEWSPVGVYQAVFDKTESLQKMYDLLAQHFTQLAAQLKGTL